MADDATRPPPRDAEEGRPNQVVAFSRSPESERPLHNLPLELTSFIGREREIAEVKRLLVDHRLLTLTGPGGSGKTRLALAVSADLVEEYEDGVWLMELASLADSDLVPQAVASVLEVREQPGRLLTHTLSDRLGTKKMLLVLDNCEHLIEACADLAGALLRSCPNLRVLATSRENLGITGETSWPVPPLSLPDPRHLPAIESLPRYEAARLFIERAAAVEPGFELTTQNAMAIARACYRLDGIPLAIELAAARVKVLSVEQIAGRLDESFRVLTSGSRTAMLRHQTLRATMDWSHELLSGEEQVLFRRLAVFAGGFTLEAAEAVCVGEDLEREEILEVLSRLVDKSLVVTREQDGEARYRLLETVRQYGWEKLEKSGEKAEVSQRHAEFFLQLAEEAEPELKGHEQVAWLDRLERDHDNLRAAMRHFLDHDRTESVARLAWALWFFWRAHGYQGEGYRYTGEALEKGDVLPTDARATLLCVRGIMSYGLESVEGTKRLWEQSADLFRQTDNLSSLALALGGLALMALARGDLERSTAFFEEALGLYGEIGDRWGMGAVLVHKGLIPLSRGEYERAVQYFEEALEISREIGDRLVCSHALHHLAWTSQLRGDHERAARLYEEVLSVAVELGDRAGVAYGLEGMADLIATGDELERKARLYGASEAILETVGAPLYVQVQDRDAYNRAVEELRSRLSGEAFEAAWAEGREMNPERAIEYALEKPVKPEAEAPPAYPAGLSAREAEVLKLVAKGLTNARIAQELFISPRTVNGHLNSIYNKLGFSSRVEATRFALEHNLL